MSEKQKEDKSPPAPWCFDENGDLTLVVGDEKRRFIVCSRSLARMSPVFQRMLYGKFCESRSSSNRPDPWVVELPEDPPAATEWMLWIVHGSFRRVPAVLKELELLSVLIFVDKYDMTESIRPFIRRWKASLYSWPPRVSDHDCLALVRIAWELGDSDALDEIAKKLVLDSVVNKEGQLCHDHHAFAPPGPIEQPSMDMVPFDFVGKLLWGFECYTLG